MEPNRQRDKSLGESITCGHGDRRIDFSMDKLSHRRKLTFIDGMGTNSAIHSLLSDKIFSIKLSTLRLVGVLDFHKFLGFILYT